MLDFKMGKILIFFIFVLTPDLLYFSAVSHRCNELSIKVSG